MIRKYTLPAIVLSVLFIFPFSTLATATTSSTRAVLLSRYSKAHSLGDNYVFDPRDGWKSVNATNLPYKYSHNTPFNKAAAADLERRDDKHKNKPKVDLGGIIQNIWDGLRAFGKPQIVEITWYIGITEGRCSLTYVINLPRYTGYDLLNPSCWTQKTWAPTVCLTTY